MDTGKRPLWIEILLMLLAPILGMALGVGVMFLLDLNGTDYGNLIVNLFFLISVIVLIRLFNFSSVDLGLKIIKEQMQKHVSLSLLIFALYLLFYIFIIRISSLKPFSSDTFWGLLTYFVVVLAEEIYFRGAFYSFFEKRLSAKTALIVSSILFGLLHAQQGLRGILSKMMTGWLWGSIRYSTGMIFLIIIPIHFAYNSIWLLFEGNWNNPPTWAAYALPAVEFLIGLLFVITNDAKVKSSERANK
jgi:membrane protease YdiL (CAAX protease family)